MRTERQRNPKMEVVSKRRETQSLNRESPPYRPYTTTRVGWVEKQSLKQYCVEGETEEMALPQIYNYIYCGYNTYPSLPHQCLCNNVINTR